MPRLKNPVHEKFARLVAAGKSNIEAYRLTKGEDVGSQAASHAATLRKRIDVDNRIKEIVDEDCRKFEITKEEALKMLAQMLKMSPADADLKNPLCDIKYVGREAVPVPLTPDRLKTLERIAKMQGWDKETVEVSASQQVLDMLEDFKD